MFPHHQVHYRLAKSLVEERVHQAAADRRYREALEHQRQQARHREPESSLLLGAWHRLLAWLWRRPAL